MKDEKPWLRTHRFEFWMGVSVALAVLVTAGVSSWIRWPGWVHSLDWVDWGNVPTWAGTFLTVIAVSIAMFTTVGDRHQRARQELQDRQAQARLVRVDGDSGEPVLRNHSDTVVFDVVCENFEVHGDVMFTYMNYQSGLAILRPRRQKFRSLPAGASRILSHPQRLLTPPRTPIEELVNMNSFSRHRTVSLTYEFTDARGRFWRKKTWLEGSDAPDTIVELDRR